MIYGRLLIYEYVIGTEQTGVVQNRLMISKANNLRVWWMTCQLVKMYPQLALTYPLNYSYSLICPLLWLTSLLGPPEGIFLKALELSSWVVFLDMFSHSWKDKNVLMALLSIMGKSLEKVRQQHSSDSIEEGNKTFLWNRNKVICYSWIYLLPPFLIVLPSPYCFR